MAKTQLPRGHISVEEAVSIINSDSLENPKCDITRMMRSIDYVKRGNNFNIFMLKKVGNRLVKLAGVPAVIEDNLGAELLKKALKDKYAELSGREFNEETHNLHAATTVVEDDNQNGVPRKSRGIAKKHKIKGGNIDIKDAAEDLIEK